MEFSSKQSSDNEAFPNALGSSYDIPSFDEAFDSQSLLKFYQTKKSDEHPIQQSQDMDNQRSQKEEFAVSNNGQGGYSSFGLPRYLERCNDDNPMYKIDQELASDNQLESIPLSNQGQTEHNQEKLVMDQLASDLANLETGTTSKVRYEETIDEYKIILPKKSHDLKTKPKENKPENNPTEKIIDREDFLIRGRKLLLSKDIFKKRSSSQKRNISEFIPTRNSFSVAAGPRGNNKENLGFGGYYDSEMPSEQNVKSLMIEYYKTIYGKRQSTKISENKI